MQLEQALSQITEIRAQIARTETFRGYRPLTIGFSGVLGILAALLQASDHSTWAVQAPFWEYSRFLDDYLRLWGGVAVLSVAVVGVELAWSCWITDSARHRRLTRLAIEQFVPCLVAGAAVTLVLLKSAPTAMWIMPGLWAILFSLGVFASCRLLPPAMFWVGGWYLLTGLGCLWLGRDEWALSPWLMGVTFGGGQLLTAALLAGTQERRT